MAPVEKSASKWVLMIALKLEESNKSHQELYNAMKREAVEVYDAMLKGRRHRLKPEFARISEPWSYSHFTEDALRTAIHAIESSASSRTRPLYARGHMAGGDNWVIRWFLYHICRYRDARNLRASRSSSFHGDDHVEGFGSSSSSAASSSRNPPSSSAPGRNYDAARNSYK